MGQGLLFIITWIVISFFSFVPASFLRAEDLGNSMAVSTGGGYTAAPASYGNSFQPVANVLPAAAADSGQSADAFANPQLSIKSVPESGSAPSMESAVSYSGLTPEQTSSTASLLINNGYTQSPDTFTSGLSDVFNDAAANVKNYFGSQAGNYDLTYDTILLFDPGSLSQQDADTLKAQGVDITKVDTLRVNYQGKDTLIMNRNNFADMEIQNSDGTPGHDYQPAVETAARREVNTAVELKLAGQGLQQAGEKARAAETDYAIWSALGQKYEHKEQAVAPLIAQLNSDDYPTREKTVKTLGLIGEPAVQPLLTEFTDPKSKQGLGAFLALQEIGSPAVEPLLKLLPSAKDDVLGNTIYLLGLIGDKRAAGPIIPFLKSENATTRQIAATSLGFIKDTAAVEPLISALSDTDASVRADVVDALGSIGDTKAVEPLIPLLKDSDSYVRSETARALGSLKDSRAVDSLIGSLKDDNADVRTAAAESLGKIGTEAAVTALLNTLTTGTDSDRKAAVSGLAAAGTTAVEPLIKILESDKSDAATKINAATALGKIRDSRAVEPLIHFLESGNEDNMKAAANALVSIGKDSTPALIGLLSNGNFYIKRIAAESLGKIKDPSAIEPLIPLLSDFTTSWEAGKALAAIGQKAVEPLITLLGNTKDTRTRQAAIRTLGDIKSPGTAEKLIPFLKDSDTTTRMVTVIALDKIGDAQGLQALVGSLGSEDNSANREIAEMALLNHFGMDKTMQMINDNKKAGSQQQAAYYDRSISNLQRRSEIVNSLSTKYGISVMDGKDGNLYFSLYQLEYLNTVFTNIPAKLLSGLHQVYLLAPDGKHAGGAAGGIMGLHDLSMDLKTIFHETGHLIDEKFYGFNAFGALYSKSKSDEDFAYDYGKTDKLEDFATCVEMYTQNSKTELERAVNQAEAGNTVYLEKMLFVTDVFAKGNDDKVVFYRTDADDTVHRSEAAVTRDAQGKMITIGGISVYNADGSYNFAGLKEYFQGLTF